MLVEVAIPVLLFALLRPVSRTIARTAAFARLAEGLVIGIGLLDHLAALRLVGDTAYLAAIDRQQREALALLVLEATAGRRLPARRSVVRRGRQGDRHGVVAVRSSACSLRDGRTRRARSGTCEPTSTASAGSATDG